MLKGVIEMDEKNNHPEEQKNEEIIEQQDIEVKNDESAEQDTPAAEVIDESKASEVPTPKVAKLKLPLIIGGIVALCVDHNQATYSAIYCPLGAALGHI